MSGNGVGDYNLIQHGLEPTGRTRQLLPDREDNVNLARPHANNYIKATSETFSPGLIAGGDLRGHLSEKMIEGRSSL